MSNKYPPLKSASAHKVLIREYTLCVKPDACNDDVDFKCGFKRHIKAVEIYAIKKRMLILIAKMEASVDSLLHYLVMNFNEQKLKDHHTIGVSCFKNISISLK